MISLTDAKKRKPQELRIHCDEAGRGPLAGPVTVGCVLMIGKADLHMYKDSKKLTKKQREACYTQIMSDTPHTANTNTGKLLTATGRASEKEIDTHGIITSIHLACLRGMGALLKKYYEDTLRDQLISSDFGEDILAMRWYDKLFDTPIDETTIHGFMNIPNSFAVLAGIIRDGNHTFGLDTVLELPVITIIKGDQKNPLISAASIVAKVERDAYMTHIAKNFPQYYFDKHKGYGSRVHREMISMYGLSDIHRRSFCTQIILSAKKKKPKKEKIAYTNISHTRKQKTTQGGNQKPSLLLHICCAPDLSRPLHRLKEHFKLYLFRYNPNIHPRKEHEQRYSQFLKLVGLEIGDYEILEDRYDPKEFFQAMIDQKESIDPTLASATPKEVLKQAGAMAERSDRCNPCYSMRLEMAARMAAKQGISYFTSTLLISPKKKMDKLFRRGKESEKTYPGTKFLRFDFPKKGGYEKANELTRKHGLRRQNYCGCGRTVPQGGQDTSSYRGG